MFERLLEGLWKLILMNLGLRASKQVRASDTADYLSEQITCYAKASEKSGRSETHGNRHPGPNGLI